MVSYQNPQEHHNLIFVTFLTETKNDDYFIYHLAFASALK